MGLLSHILPKGIIGTTHLPLFIARRYLFSKKSHNAINIISAISVAGVAIATLALVCTLSVFNGFKDLVGSLYTEFDPELKIVPAKGKMMESTDIRLQTVRKDARIAAAAECLEDHALILFQGHPLVVQVKGVSPEFEQVTGIDSILYGRGRGFQLSSGGVEYGIPGRWLAERIIGPGNYDYGSLQICAPKKGERINAANPIESFNVEELVSPGLVFAVNQKKYDDRYFLTSLDFTQALFDQAGMITSLELRLKSPQDIPSAQQHFQKSLGSNFRVLNQAEQQEEVFAIMNLEKTIAYLFLTFILIVACFNIIGSVSMLILEKKSDAAVLSCLGATDKMVRRIFFAEGALITLLGAILGIAGGLLLCYVQMEFGLLKLGGDEGNFIITAYPVSVHPQDILLVFLTVVVVGFAAVWYPVNYLSKRFLG